MAPKRRNQARRGSRTTLHPALVVIALLVVAAAFSWSVGWIGGGSGPLAVARVPSTLPARGVQLEDGAIVLTPWPTAPAGVISPDQAIAAARPVSWDGHWPATALKAELTMPRGFPPGTVEPHPYRTIDHVPVWLVTFTPPKPINASGGGLLSFYVTQFSYALSPVTGKFLIGFEIPPA